MTCDSFAYMPSFVFGMDPSHVMSRVICYQPKVSPNGWKAADRPFSNTRSEQRFVARREGNKFQLRLESGLRQHGSDFIIRHWENGSGGCCKNRLRSIPKRLTTFQ
jgi:hypothetical protein